MNLLCRNRRTTEISLTWVRMIVTRLLIFNIAIDASLTMVVGQVGSNINMYFHISGACPFHNVTRILGVVANWADVALAINRLIAVCFPFLYTHFASGKVGGSVCGLTWLIGIVVVILLRSGIGSFFKEVRSIWFLSYGYYLRFRTVFIAHVGVCS